MKIINIQHLKDFLVKIPITNVKSSLDFDNKYGTKISQQYNFPFGFTDDDIWKMMEALPNDVRYSGKSDGTEIADLYNMILYSIDYKHFPYKNIVNLSLEQKVIILEGMCSNFNVDDIISFSINNICYYESLAVEKLKIHYTNNYNNETYITINSYIGWVPSMETAEKIIKSVKIL